MSQATTNTQILSADLPRASDVRFEKLDPNYPLSGGILWALLVLAILAAAPFVLDIETERGTVREVMSWRLIFLASIPLAAIWNVWELARRGYAIRQQDVMLKKGIVWQSVIIVPFSRVQHVETNRGPIARLFGLAAIKIFTAGGTGADLTIDGLKAEHAVTLKQAIIKRVYETQSGITAEDHAGDISSAAATRTEGADA